VVQPTPTSGSKKRFTDPDPHLHYFWKLDSDPDLHSREKLYPDGEEALEAQNRAVEGRGRSQWRREGSKWSNGGSLEK